jgi:hypothetical protein
MKETISQAAKWATVAGSVVIAVGAVNTLATKPFTAKDGAMPIVTLLVAVSAFSWAMTQPVTIVPVTKGA